MLLCFSHGKRGELGWVSFRLRFSFSLFSSFVFGFVAAAGQNESHDRRVEWERSGEHGFSHSLSTVVSILLLYSFARAGLEL